MNDSNLLLGCIIKCDARPAGAPRMFRKIVAVAYSEAGADPPGWDVLCVDRFGAFSMPRVFIGDGAPSPWTLSCQTDLSLADLERLEREGRLGTLGQVLGFDKDGNIVPEMVGP